MSTIVVGYVPNAPDVTGPQIGQVRPDR